MYEIIQQRIDAASKSHPLTGKPNLAVLHQLHGALTEHRPHSHYSSWSQADADAAAQDVADAITRLDPSYVATVAKAAAQAAKKAAQPPRTRARCIPPPLDPWDLQGLQNADLFADTARWPRRPFCTQNVVRDGLTRLSLADAVTHREIQHNPPHVRVWSVFDIDRRDAAEAWKVAELPPPTWIATNRDSGNAHLVWGLRVPVLVEALRPRVAPVRYLAAIESLMTIRLRADRGYNGLMTHNPAHPNWDVWRGPRADYALHELAACLPGIKQYRPPKRAEVRGLGRNCDLYDHLSAWAYRAVRPYWLASSPLHAEMGWYSACRAEADAYNAGFPSPLGDNEVRGIVKSIARWVWRNTTDSGFREWQAAQGAKGGKASGEARRTASADRRSDARLRAQEGHSTRQIAAALGVDHSTVVRWLRAPPGGG